ncbi:MAG TPA: proton-conducting transporter membrane subunit [Phycisphaerae bacterium]|nr:proton-conducting transporter membrane subunit [Phycisphaerae bacterium]
MINVAATIDWNGFSPVYPMLFIVGTIFVLLTLPIIQGKRQGTYYNLIAFSGLTLSLLSVLQQAGADQNEALIKPDSSGALGSGLLLDPMNWLLGLLIICCALFSVMLTSLTGQNKSRTDLPEHFIFILVSAIGWRLAISSNNFLMLFVGINTGALPLFLLIAQRSNRLGRQAVLNMCVRGLVCLAIIFYGTSLYYFGFHTTSFNPASVSTTPFNVRVLITLGLLLVLSGYLYFSGCFPAHLWMADIQEACDPGVAFFSATAPVLACFAFILRIIPLMEQIGGSFTNKFNVFAVYFIVCGVLTCISANIAALAERNLLRMLGRLTNGLVGGLLLSIGAVFMISKMFTNTGRAAIAGNVILYVLTIGLSFPGILVLVQNERVVEFSDLPAAASRKPLAAFCAVIAVGSMVGFPLTSGFVFKLRLAALLTSHINWSTLFAIAGFAVGTLLSIIVWLRLSAWIYIRGMVVERIKTGSAMLVLAVALALPNAALAVVYDPLNRLVDAFTPLTPANQNTMPSMPPIRQE